MSPWFLAPTPRPAARMKLFLVPHAGRGASLFMPWRNELPEWIEMSAVQLPGREARRNELPLRRLSAMAEGLAGEMLPQLDRPYVLFGHSMGALVCFETARVLRRLGAPLPRALVLSGRRAPNNPDKSTPIHGLPDAEFVAAVCERYNGIPQIILDQPDMMRMVLPVMRSDMEAIETYTYRPEAALEVPFFLYGGRDDAQLSPEDLAAWGHLTRERIAQRMFAGGHFYLQDDRGPLLRALVADLATLIPPPHAETPSQRGPAAPASGEVAEVSGCNR